MYLIIKNIYYNIINICKIDLYITVALLILYIINILIQYSASNQDINRFTNDVIYIILSIGIFFFISNLNINQLKNIAIPLYIISIVLLLLILLIGININGATRWINIGIRIQPSEIAKLSIPLFFAYYCAKKSTKIIVIDYIILGSILLITTTLIAKQPDLGTAILVFLSGFFILFFAGLSSRFIFIIIALLLLSTPLIWHHLHEYQQHRILTLLNPQSDPLGKGYHIIQGMIAIGSGGFWGNGYLNGTQTHLNFTPEKHTDFVATVIAEEFGFLGIMFIVILYFILINRGINIMKHSKDIFCYLLSGSIVTSLACYIIINMGMVAGILPVVGIPLPFISYGGTTTIILTINIAILIAIKEHNKY